MSRRSELQNGKTMHAKIISFKVTRSFPPWVRKFPTCLLHLEASKRLIRHLQIISKALGIVPVRLIEKHEQDRKFLCNLNAQPFGFYVVSKNLRKAGSDAGQKGQLWYFLGIIVAELQLEIYPLLQQILPQFQRFSNFENDPQICERQE